jgi:hypothetical protein
MRQLNLKMKKNVVNIMKNTFKANKRNSLDNSQIALKSGSLGKVDSFFILFICL